MKKAVFLNKTTHKRNRKQKIRLKATSNTRIDCTGNKIESGSIQGKDSAAGIKHKPKVNDKYKDIEQRKIDKALKQTLGTTGNKLTDTGIFIRQENITGIKD